MQAVIFKETVCIWRIKIDLKELCQEPAIHTKGCADKVWRLV
jgi:hypothetical protein